MFKIVFSECGGNVRCFDNVIAYNVPHLSNLTSRECINIWKTDI
jgi:hypothetical protein